MNGRKVRKRNEVKSSQEESETEKANEREAKGRRKGEIDIRLE